MEKKLKEEQSWSIWPNQEKKEPAATEKITTEEAIKLSTYKDRAWAHTRHG